MEIKRRTFIASSVAAAAGGAVVSSRSNSSRFSSARCTASSELTSGTSFKARA